MPRKKTQPRFKTYKSSLRKERSTFKKQMKIVRGKYPLVALAYSMQQALIAGTGIRGKTLGPIAELIHALTEVKIYVNPAPHLVINPCFERFENCMDAHNAQNAGPCFDGLSRCLNNRKLN